MFSNHAENEILKEAKIKYLTVWNKAEQEKAKVKNSKNKNYLKYM